MKHASCGSAGERSYVTYQLHEYILNYFTFLQCFIVQQNDSPVLNDKHRTILYTLYCHAGLQNSLLAGYTVVNLKMNKLKINK